MPGTLTAPDPEGVVRELPRISPSVATKQLGVFLAGNGQMKDEIAYLKEKSRAWAQNMSRGSILEKHEAWIDYTHTIYKTIEYPMSATTITLEEWKKIMSPANQAALPKSGIVRTLGHAFLYGPKKYQGLGVMEPWHNQELTHLQDLVTEVTKGSSHGFYFRASIEALRMETGYPGPFTEIPWELMNKGATPCLLTTMWESMQEFPN